MADSTLVLRVVDWDRRYETKASLRKAGPLATVPATTDLGEVRLQRLLDLPGGLHAYGIWNILWRLAARCSRRGVLADGGVALTPKELAQAAKCSVPEIEQAVKLLRSPGVELLERVPLEQAIQPPDIPPPAPRKPRKVYSFPFSHCPTCHTDLVAAAEQMGGCGCKHDDCQCEQDLQDSHEVMKHTAGHSPHDSRMAARSLPRATINVQESDRAAVLRSPDASFSSTKTRLVDGQKCPSYGRQQTADNPQLATN